MKNLKFVLGILVGVLISTLVFIIISNKLKNMATPYKSSTIINQDNRFEYQAYRLTVDDTQYIVVINNNEGGIAIVKHNK